jgi:hypothetical protein
MFRNDAVIVRLAGDMMRRHDDEWILNQRSMPLEAVQAVRDTAPTRLPGVAR